MLHRVVPSLISFLALLAATALPTAAQQRVVSLNLCCLRYHGDIRSLLIKPRAASAPEETPIYQGGFADTIPALVENQAIVIYRKGNDEKTPWVPDWTIPITGNQSRFTAILLPSAATTQDSSIPADAAPYRPMVLPPASDFQFGSLMAANLTPHNVRLDLGQQKLPLKPGAKATANLAKEADAYQMVTVTAWIQSANEKWLTLHSTQWPYNERYRQIAIIWMDPTIKRPEITTLREVQPAPLPTPP